MYKKSIRMVIDKSYPHLVLDQEDPDIERLRHSPRLHARRMIRLHQVLQLLMNALVFNQMLYWH